MCGQRVASLVNVYKPKEHFAEREKVRVYPNSVTKGL